MSTLNENIPFLYGELNKTTEYIRYKSTTLDIDNSNYNIEINPNTLVTLKRIKVDSSLEDDVIKNYGLFAYNPKTAQFDILLGDTILIGPSIGVGPSTDINEVKVGNQSIPFSFNAAGQLVLEYIPANAIKNTSDSPKYNEETGEWELYESILDGNVSIKL